MLRNSGYISVYLKSCQLVHFVQREKKEILSGTPKRKHCLNINQWNSHWNSDWNSEWNGMEWNGIRIGIRNGIENGIRNGIQKWFKIVKTLRFVENYMSNEARTKLKTFYKA